MLKIGSLIEPLKTTTLPFGKYKGISLDEVPLQYLRWVLECKIFRF